MPTITVKPAREVRSKTRASLLVRSATWAAALLIAASLAACGRIAEPVVEVGGAEVLAEPLGRPGGPVVLHGAVVEGIVRIYLEAPDALGTIAYYLGDRAPGADTVAMVATPPYEFVLDTGALRPGAHVLEVFQVDADADQTPLRRVVFTVARPGDGDADRDPGAPLTPSPSYDHLRQLFVSPSGSDGASGAEDAPLRTIGAGIERAAQLRREGHGVRINVHPGIYRESLIGSFSSAAAPLIVIEALTPGSAVVSGSDIWTDWACSGDVCTHAWPFDWGAAENPWPRIEVGELARRQEIIAVNGVNLDQHLSRSALTPGSFYVDEANRRVIVRAPTGVALERALVEVGVRPTLMRLQGLSDFVVKGLRFTHAATPFRGSAVQIVDQFRVVIEDSVFEWNGQNGISFKGRHFTVRNNVMRHNGSSGMSGFRVADALFEGNETSFNNWRGLRGNYLGWEVGHKFFQAHRLTFIRHHSHSNFSRGLWFDTDIADILIEDSTFCDNLRDAIFFEAVQGPVVVRSSDFCRNGEGGVLTSAVHGLELSGNTFDRNGRAAVVISGDFNRKVTDFETGASYVLNNRDWTWRGNAMVGTGEHFLVTTTHTDSQWSDLMRGSDLDRNTYVHSVADAFRVPGGSRADFARWQRSTSQDGSSSFALLADGR